MAHRLMFSVKCVINPLRNTYPLSGTLFRGFSVVKTPQELEDCTAVSDDGSIVVCWHPERPILYEHTRPIPATELDDNKSVLKTIDMKHLQRPQPDEFVRERLMELTATTKHRWFPNSRRKKERKRPFDREHL